MFSTEPSGNLAWAFSYGIGKLFLRKSLFLHKEVKTVGNLERQPRLSPLFRRYVTQKFPERSLSPFHISKVFSVAIPFSVMMTLSDDYDQMVRKARRVWRRMPSLVLGADSRSVTTVFS